MGLPEIGTKSYLNMGALADEFGKSRSNVSLTSFHKDAANGISTKRVEKNIIKKEHIHLGSFSSPVF